MAAIDIIRDDIKNMSNASWEYLCGNSAAISLINDIAKTGRIIDWPALSENKSAIDIIVNDILRNRDKIFNGIV